MAKMAKARYIQRAQFLLALFVLILWIIMTQNNFENKATVNFVLLMIFQTIWLIFLSSLISYILKANS